MAGTDLFLWLHGLMAVVLDKNNLRIITPGPAANHACLLGRVTNHDPATWNLADVKGWLVLEGISSPTVLPPRSPKFDSFVIENVSDIRYDQSAFVLTVPLPDAILPLRVTLMPVKPKAGSNTIPFHSGDLPLLIVFQYSNANLDRVRIPGLWQPPAIPDGPVHLHLYVEPDPREAAENPPHDPQSDLDKLVDLFPSTLKFDVPIPKDPTNPSGPPPRKCGILVPKPDLPGVLLDSAGAVIEQLDLWEWFNQCDLPANRPVPPLTFQGGICPTGMFVLKGVTWTKLPA
jgi:hypothetical protein